MEVEYYVECDEDGGINKVSVCKDCIPQIQRYIGELRQTGTETNPIMRANDSFDETYDEEYTNDVVADGLEYIIKHADKNTSNYYIKLRWA
jgi:hypothetical protein